MPRSIAIWESFDGSTLLSLVSLWNNHQTIPAFCYRFDFLTVRGLCAHHQRRAPRCGPRSAVTPTDLHYERSYAGIPDLDPAKHRLLTHWMVRKPLVLTVNDLEAMCLPSRGSRKGHMSLPPWWFQEPRRCIEVTFLAVARS